MTSPADMLTAVCQWYNC